MSSWQAYPRSVIGDVFAAKGSEGDVLVVSGKAQPMDHEAAAFLREKFPFTAPRRVLHHPRTFGVGDRLGIATSGHLRVFERFDAVPVLAQMNEHVPALYGADLRDYYTNAALFVEANLAVYQYYAVDLPGFYYDIYNVEAEALGQRLNWEQDRMPEIDRSQPLIREHSDLDRLRPPDPRRAGRYPFVLEAIKRTYELGIPMRLRLCSPFTLATNVRGIEQFLVDIYTAPEFAHRLLRAPRAR